MSIATLTNTNKITIPNDILICLGLKTGDQLDFVVEKGSVVLHPVTVDARDLKGILKRETNKTVSTEDMNVAIVRGAIGESE